MLLPCIVWIEDTPQPLTAHRIRVEQKRLRISARLEKDLSPQTMKET